jgi:hypothetical protein
MLPVSFWRWCEMVHDAPANTRTRRKGGEAPEAGVGWAAAMLEFEHHAEHLDTAVRG